MFDTYRRAQAAGIAALRPGARNRDVDTAAQEVFAAAGYGDFYVSGISHSIGLDFEEKPRPTIHTADAQVQLQADMTVTVGHSVLSVPGIGGVRIEDTFHLKEDGPELLTTGAADFELPAGRLANLRSWNERNGMSAKPPDRR
jgi:Xaa-Pro aminopeptidase